MKNMLTDNDIKRIGEELGQVIEHNVNPQFEDVRNRLDKVESRLDRVEATMVTKDYLDDKLADLEGKLVAQDRKLERKTDALVETLAARRVLAASDIKRLEKARVFPQTRA